MNTNTLKCLPAEERPRERLIMYGANKVSSAELLAIILHTGTIDTSVKDLAKSILYKYGNIQGLRNATMHSLCEIKGISTAKSIALLAAIELGKRVYESDIIKQNIKITCAIDAYKYFSKYIKDETRESFMVIFLDNQQKYISHKIIFTGTINKAEIYGRDIIKEALLENSNKIILMHNHPSGVLTPSSSDDEVTKRIINAASLLEIELLDHLIVGGSDYYSYVEEGKIRYE